MSSPVPSDAMLLQRVVSQDQAALRLLFDRHAAWLTLRLRRRTSDHDVVATVLQDTFVAVWRGSTEAPVTSARGYGGSRSAG